MGVDTKLYLNTRWELDDIKTVLERTQGKKVTIRSKDQDRGGKKEMPTTQALLKAYGNIPMPDRMDGMTYQEAFSEKSNRFYIRQDLMRLYERDTATIKENRGSQPLV